MRAVIDVGCANYGGARSIPSLIERFQPDIVYGFDPEPDEVNLNVKRLVRSYQAAYTYNGTIGFTSNSTSSHVGGAQTVGCVDLAEFIDGIPADCSIVLKLDCEGAEYEILQHLHEQGVDRRLELLLVEWHPGGEPPMLDCPVEPWWM